MNKLELIDALSREADIPKPDAGKIVRMFFGLMTDTLAKGDRVEVCGLLSFYVKKYKAYTGRNPKTGQPVKVKPKKMPFFKPGKELRDRVDPEG